MTFLFLLSHILAKQFATFLYSFPVLVRNIFITFRASLCHIAFDAFVVGSEFCSLLRDLSAFQRFCCAICTYFYHQPMCSWIKSTSFSNLALSSPALMPQLSFHTTAHIHKVVLTALNRIWVCAFPFCHNSSAPFMCKSLLGSRYVS